MSDKNPSRKQPSRLSTPIRLGVAAVAACFISTPILSNPLNPTVVNGAATFNQAGNVLTVTNSNGAIINWNKFSIKTGETTYFAQTSASSTVLNRVLNDPTTIYGTLGSNGRVWLVNPAGIMVGPGGRIDVAGFVASTLNIRNEDFLAGRNVFINDGSARNVINQGEIRTPAGGSVYLIGSNVSNEGIITTPQGETILAAGATVSLIDSATPGVKVDITGAEGNATNLGTLTAEAGRIGIAGVIVRNSGLLNASSVVSEGGRVFLKASQDAYVDGNGRIVTTGTKGGSVEVLGSRVAVMDNAEIDASGTGDANAGGGRIMIGGDYQGKNPEIQNARITYFGPDATLKADAGKVGNGGTVIVWADDTTRAHGDISAQGGVGGGKGGFVETSGHRYLDIAGARVDTLAPQGATGQWLLDPTQVTISGTPPTTGGSILGGMFAPSAGSSTIYAGDINSNLVNNNVVISTNSSYGGNGSITATGVTINNGTAAYGLTLAAYGGGSATGNISITNSTFSVYGGVNMLAGWDGSGNTYGDVIPGKGDISIVASTIKSDSGAITLSAGRDLTFTGGSNPTIIGSEYGGNTIGVQVGGNIFLNGGAGGILIGSLDASNGFYSVELSASKNITITGDSGGVWLGVKNLTGPSSSVSLKAGWNADGGEGSGPSSFGGNIQMVGPGGTYIQTSAYGGVGLFAYQATTANGNIMQNPSSKIYGGSVSVWAEGNLTLNGGTFALNDGTFTNSLEAVAGIDASYRFGYPNTESPYGGDVSIGGQLQAVGGSIEIFALSGGATGARGKITQVTGSAIYGSDIVMGAWGNVGLSGTVSATTNLGVTAGNAIDCNDGCYSSSNASPQGGNISVSGALSGYGVELIAEVGSITGLKGGITQSAGSITAGYGEVRIIGGGNVMLNSIIDGGEGAVLVSGTGITLGPSASISSNDFGDAISLVSSGAFTNNNSGDPLDASNGRWLIYADNPGVVTKGGLLSAFRHYDATYDSYPSPLETGDGFIYASLPGAITVNTTLASGAPSNVYGETPTAVFGYTFGGTFDKEDITGAATFTPVISSTTNVGSYTVSYYGGLMVGVTPIYYGGQVGTPASFTFTVGSGFNYTVDPAILAIIAASLTGTTSKIYDGSTTAILAPGNFILTNFVNGDSASVTKTTGTYESKNVGSNMLVSTTLAPSDFSPSGSTNLSNYTLPTSASGNIGIITQAPLNVTAVGVNKVYDGLTTATASLSDNRVAGDVLALGMGSASYLDRHVGVAKPVNISGITLDGADAGNYNLTSSTATTTANITQLGSVTWTGGPNGNWSLASNWAGGALPDANNVAAVLIPPGSTVTFDGATAATTLNTLTSSGGLLMAGSNLAVNSALTTSSYQQTGGSLTGTGSFTVTNSFAQTGGSIALTGAAPVSITTTGDARVGSLSNPGGTVTITANNAILDENGTALNVTANNVNLTSVYGGNAGSLAISLDTSATSALFGSIAPGATYGGIEIRNSGTGPGFVSLTDQAAFQSSANFTQNGDLTVGDGGTAITMTADSLALLSTGNMTIQSSGLSLTATAAYGSILIGASGNMLLDGADISPAANVDVGLAAGGSMTLTNGAYAHGENLVAAAGQGVSLAYGSEIGASQTAIVTAGSSIGLEGSNIHSDFGDAYLIAGSDIRVNNGSSISAGNSIYLVMNGGASTLYVNEFAGLSPSYIHALNPNTINVEFAAQTSGGIVIDGVATTTTSSSSGFFVGPSMTPATTTPGGGLAITYANSASSPNSAVEVDPCASSPDLCSPPAPIENPILEVVTMDPCASNPDAAQCKLRSPGDEEKAKDSFGSQEEYVENPGDAEKAKDSLGAQEEYRIKDEKWSQKTIPTCSI